MGQHASELKGFLVVAREEGAELGTLSAIRIDPETKAVVGFDIRTRRVGGKVLFAPVNVVDRLGREVLLLTSERAVREVTDVTPSPGRSLKELQGIWVTSMDGRHLGTLIDLDFSPGDWRIRELVLAEDKHLAVDPDELRIGDEILVPEQGAAQIQVSQEPKSGLIARGFGPEAVEDTKGAVKRALQGGKRPHEVD